MGVGQAAKEETRCEIAWSTEGGSVAGSWGGSGIKVGDEAQEEREATSQRVFMAEQKGPYFILKAKRYKPRSGMNRFGVQITQPNAENALAEELVRRNGNNPGN